MASFNKVILMGNLTRDPELKYTPKGSAVAVFGLAVNRKWKAEDGTAKEEVTFLDLQAWGKSAETIANYCKKGSSLHVEGRLSQEVWTDKESGQRKSKTRVVVESFQFVGGRQEKPDAKTQPKITPADIPQDPTDDVPF